MLDTVKFFEVRDRATCVPCFAFRPVGQILSPRQWLAQRAGYNGTVNDEQTVMFGRLMGGRVEYDPYAWGDRTMQTAHLYITENFHNLEDAAVVDVEFIRGETSSPKSSDRQSEYYV